jgi:Rrf2 family nitric oxide-sensitive transcriptional repressor
MYLSQLEDGRLATMKDISGFYEISTEHLRKVVHTLSKQGYIESFRGKHGGLRLGRAPSEINIGKLVCMLEGGTSIIDCKGRNCVLSSDCELQGALLTAMKAFYLSLEQYTLGDIVSKPGLQDQFTVITRS